MKRQAVFILVSAVVVTLLIVLTPLASAAPSSASSIIHVVRPGETLYGIARYYGVDMWVIARTNNILNPNRIYVGQRLVIPTGGTAGFIHIVRPGETLTQIALRYGVSAWAIAQANGIYNMNYIWAGQRLLIPGGYYAPSPTPSGGDWYGQYYNNLTLTDPPCYTRYDSGVNFNWGWGTPAPGVPADGFSVRWTRTAYFSGGTYRFYARVDDGVRVWVDGALIIDQWRDGAVRTFSADRTLSAGNHDIRVEFYDRIQVARIHFWWEKVGPTPTETPAPTETPVGEGWFAQFYNNMDLQSPPVATRYDPWIGFEWGTGSPMPGVRSDFFSARWTTTAYLEGGTYRFCAMIDDGARIYVDGIRVLDEWHPTNGVAFCGEHAVATGNHEIEVQYYEEGGNALIYVWWEKE